MATTAIAQYSKPILPAKCAPDCCRPGQKELPSKYLYDEVGSALFEVISVLPEYGLTRADERLLRRHAADIVAPPEAARCWWRNWAAAAEKNALDAGSPGAPPAHHLLPDRNFSHRAGALRKRTGPDRLREHRRLRAALSGRPAAPPLPGGETTTICWCYFWAARSAISTATRPSVSCAKCAASCFPATRCCWARTWKNRCRNCWRPMTIRSA